jgi:hypothetical protein
MSGRLQDSAALTRGKDPRYPLDKMMDRPQSQTGRRGEDKNPAPTRIRHPDQSSPVTCFWPSSAQSFLVSGQSVKLLLTFDSSLIQGYSLLEIHEQDLYSLLDMYVFRNGASSSMKKRSAFLCRRYVRCTVVSARVYPRCHCTILRNIYTRYTQVSSQRIRV